MKTKFMSKKDSELQKKFDDLLKSSDYFIASPETIANTDSIKKVVTSYNQYLDELFTKRRKVADELTKQLPHLDNQIANGSITFLYEELKECFLMGIPGASIVLAILLLDLATKLRLFKELRNENPQASYKSIENMLLREVILKLRDHGAITDEEEIELLNFNKNVRNNYLHYNIQKLVKDMTLKELPSVNFQTGEIKTEYNIKLTNRPELWFSAKKVLDRETVITRVNFCLHFVNLILTRPTIANKRNRDIPKSLHRKIETYLLNNIRRVMGKIKKRLKYFTFT